MRHTFHNSKFAHFYLWATKAKYTMGLFFAFYVILYLFLGLIAVPKDIQLDFWTAFEMMFACFFIGVAQQVILPVEKLSRGRCLLWMAAGALITLAFSLIFQWFVLFPLWCFVVFVAMFVLGTGAMLISYYLELYQETRKLNKQLEQFQKNRP